MDNNLLNSINLFLNQHFPNIDGCLLFGSNITNKKNPADIDLIILSKKFSYFSKSAIQFNNLDFNILKVPSFDVLNLLAEDFSKGVFKKILEQGHIIYDSMGVLLYVKNKIAKNYPTTSNIVQYKLNETTYKINMYSSKLIGRKYSKIEEFLLSSKVVSLIIDFVLYSHGIIHHREDKNKGVFFNKNFPNLALDLMKLIHLLNSNNRKAFIEYFKQIVDKLGIPKIKNYTNDYVFDVLDENRNILYIEGCKNIERTKILESSIIKQFHLAKCYSFYIDTNNIEAHGAFIVIKNLPKETKITEIKSIANKIIISQSIYFPYNSMFFNYEIKFGGLKNLTLLENELININDYFRRSKKRKLLLIIEIILLSKNLNLDSLEEYYTYKVLNNNHELSFKELNMAYKKQMQFLRTESKKIFDDYEFIINDKNIEWNNLLEPIVLLKISKLPKIIRFQFIDRLLSMLFLEDQEKSLYVTFSNLYL